MFIILGAVFDFFDGFTARLLRVSSPIGKELDSLADCITFGFAPATLLFSLLQRVIGQQYPLLPYIAFVLAAFSALRLAKFNLDERQALGFIGLPTPACCFPVSCRSFRSICRSARSPHAPQLLDAGERNPHVRPQVQALRLARQCPEVFLRPSQRIAPRASGVGRLRSHRCPLCHIVSFDV